MNDERVVVKLGVGEQRLSRKEVRELINKINEQLEDTALVYDIATPWYERMAMQLKWAIRRKMK